MFLPLSGLRTIMTAHRETFRLETKSGVQAIDITDRVTAAISTSGVMEGLACIFTPSSTSAIVTNEFEPGLMEEDIPGALERLFPEGIAYGHERRWHDGNGHSHVRATFLGPSLTIPVVDGRAALGTWQQIVFLELDNKPRRREVIVQVVGENPEARA
jgi:secondary thiamine-phosphate synthase enzyme